MTIEKTYNKVVRYACRFVPYHEAKDLVHNVYIKLNKRGVDLLDTNHANRYLYIKMYYESINRLVKVRGYRSGVRISSLDDSIYFLDSKSPTPHQLFVERELRETLPELLLLNVEGYTTKELSEIYSVSTTAINTRLRRMREGMGKVEKTVVIQRTLDGEFVKEWHTAKDAADELGIKRPNIAACLNGSRKTAGGYKWKYK